MSENLPAAGQDDMQPAQIADLRHVPMDRLTAEPECSDIVSRVLGRQGFSRRVDVAAFDSAI